jgi:hypothetical protein
VTNGEPAQEAKCHRPSIKCLAVIAGALVVGVIGTLVVRHFCSDEGHKFEALPPSEFLYIDGHRTLDYLAELEGGQVEKIRQLTNEIRSVSGGLSVSNFNLAASAQKESLAESTLTRTEWSGLNLLFKDLHENNRHGTEIHRVDLDRPVDLSEIKEGWLVKFVTHSLVAPTYIRPYVVAHESATLSALFPDRLGGHKQARRQRKRARKFVRQVGRDPRITFAVSPRSPGKGIAPLRILLPMHYLGLSTERSLLEKGRGRYSGGRLVVVGKVIRVFRRKDDQRPCTTTVERKCKRHRLVYTDLGTQEVWRSPLGHAVTNLLIGKVSHRCKTPRSDFEIEKAKKGLSKAERRLKKAEKRPARVKRKHGGSERRLKRARGRVQEARARTRRARVRFRRQQQPFTGRECLLKNLERQTRLYAPGAVILPIAIYK